MTDLLADLIRLNLVVAIAILAVLALRLPVRRTFGAPLAYSLWLSVPLAVAAALLPARMVQPEQFAPRFQLFEAPPAPSLTIAPIPVEWTTPPLDPAPYVLAFWLAGALIAAAFALWSQRRFMDLAAKSLAGPAVVGFFTPRLVLPADFEARFSEDERRVILAHETTHLARGDSRINALMVAGQCALWCNPLIHLAAHFVRVDQELACDAAVIGRHPDQRRVYAEALIKTQLAATPLLAGCYWPARAAHPLNQRITMLKSNAPSALRKGAGLAFLAVASLAGGLAAWAAQPPRQAPPAPEQPRGAANSFEPAPPVRQLFESEKEVAQRRLAPAEARRVDPRTYDIFPETKPPVVNDARAARVFAGMEKTIARDLAQPREPLTPSVARENPQAVGRLNAPPAGMSQTDVDGLKTIMALRISVANDDLSTARQRFETGIVTRTDVARAELKKLEAEASSKQLDLALEYVAGVRQEHAVGLRTREEVDRAEAQLFAIVTGQIMASSR